MDNKEMNLKINATVNMKKLREYLQAQSDEESGLESSGGLTPTDLSQAWDEFQGLLPDEPWVNFMSEIINLMYEVHTEFEEQEREDDY